MLQIPPSACPPKYAVKAIYKFPWKYFSIEIPFSAMAGDISMEEYAMAGDISMEEYAMAMDGFSMEYSATTM